MVIIKLGARKESESVKRKIYSPAAEKREIEDLGLGCSLVAAFGNQALRLLDIFFGLVSLKSIESIVRTISTRIIWWIHTQAFHP